MPIYFFDGSAVVKRYVSSLTSSGLTMISADDELNAAAAAEGLIIEDPNAHL